jgi:hypothetical protein
MRVAGWSGKASTRMASPRPRRDVMLSGLGFAAAGNGQGVGADATGSSTPTIVIRRWNRLGVGLMLAR